MLMNFVDYSKADYCVPAFCHDLGKNGLPVLPSIQRSELGDLLFGWLLTKSGNGPNFTLELRCQ